MTLTVRELVEIPFLKTRVHAGASGLDRTITWAHSCEMPRPWDWMEKGDLLMTVGMGVPESVEGQVEYVERLATAEVSGVAIGEDMLAPPLSPEMIEAADRCSLPLLITAYEVPFIHLSRTVAETNRGAAQSQMVKTVRVYDSVRAAMARSTDASSLFEYLGNEIECDLWICIEGTGEAAFAGSEPLPEVIRRIFVEETSRRDFGSEVPGLWRIEADGRTALVVPVPVQRDVSLVAMARSSDVPAYAILQHVAAIAALEFERLISAREELRRLGGETLSALLDRRLSVDAARLNLARHGFGDEPLVLLVSAAETGVPPSPHHSLAERGLAHVLLYRDPWLYCLAPAEEVSLALILSELGKAGLRVGVSGPMPDLSGLSGAVEEARWAFEVARSDGSSVARYSDGAAVGVQSLAEARATVDRVLGPVIAWDREHGSALVETLAAFLRCNRSWQQAAAELNVHKQTLVYRMKRIEELTGRRIRDTPTIAEFWLAVSALELIGAD